MSEQVPFASAAIAAHRFAAQGLVPVDTGRTPRAAAALLSCVQGQHLGGVIAALALRSTGQAADVEDAFNTGQIVRGYPMRGTVFAADAADMPWMTELAGARTVRGAARRREELELDDALMARVTDEILRLLSESEDGALSRPELSQQLSERGFPLSGPQRYHVLFTLIASGVLAYGPLRGAEHLVVAAEQWLPEGNSLVSRFNGEDLAATAEWLRRYFEGHGPASLRDFAWWTKLPLGQLRNALSAYPITDSLEQYGVDAAGEPLWGPPGLTAAVEEAQDAITGARLLPPFDEYLLGYQDRSAIVTKEHHLKIDVARNGVFKPVVYSNGRLIATWSSKGSGRNRTLEIVPFAKAPSKRVRSALEREFAKYPHRR